MFSALPPSTGLVKDLIKINFASLGQQNIKNLYSFFATVKGGIGKTNHLTLLNFKSTKSKNVNI